MSTDNDIINPGDFVSFSVTITGKNLSSGTAFKSAPPASIVEFQERQCVLELPHRSCAPGHHLLLAIKVVHTNENDPLLKFDMTVNVDDLETLETGEGDRVDRVIVTLLQFNESEWAQYIDLFTHRQNNINDFLRAAKGY